MAGPPETSVEVATSGSATLSTGDLALGMGGMAMKDYWLSHPNNHGACRTDSFTVSSPTSRKSPVICGENSGMHSKSIGLVKYCWYSEYNRRPARILLGITQPPNSIANSGYWQSGIHIRSGNLKTSGRVPAPLSSVNSIGRLCYTYC